jgi:hypothetical protein
MLFGGGSMKRPGSGENTPRGGGGGGGGFGSTPLYSPRDAPRTGERRPSLARGSGDRGAKNNSPGSSNNAPGQHSSSEWVNGDGGVNGEVSGVGGGGAHHGDYPSPRGDYQHHRGGSVFGGFFGSGGLLGGGFGVVAFVVVAGALIMACQAALYLFGWRGGGWGWGLGGGSSLGSSAEEDVVFWQRRAALLGVELKTLERRVAFVVGLYKLLESAWFQPLNL